MKKTLLILLLCGIFCGLVFAQASGGTTSGGTAKQPEVGGADPNLVGADTARQNLKEVSIDKFEAEGFWGAKISSDEGFTQGRLFAGGSKTKESEPIPDERYIGIDPKIADKYVYGVRTDFYRRGMNEIFVYARRPIPVEGITKTISVRVVGRNMNHELKLLLQDAFGGNFELSFGKLNFLGWKKLTLAVPPQSLQGQGIVQQNFHRQNRMGVRIVGFKIECDLDESYGTYYIYFDDLRAVSDLFAVDYGKEDDMPDMW